MNYNKIINKWQPILWSVDNKRIDLNKDKVYIIHQVLMYGDLVDISHLFKIYSKKEVKKVFISSPKKIYTKPAFKFIKEIILGIRIDIDPKNYVKDLVGCVK